MPGKNETQGSFIIGKYNSTLSGNIITYETPFELEYNRIILQSASFSQQFKNVNSYNNVLSFSYNAGNT